MRIQITLEVFRRHSSKLTLSRLMSFNLHQIAENKQSAATLYQTFGKIGNDSFPQNRYLRLSFFPPPAGWCCFNKVRQPTAICHS